MIPRYSATFMTIGAAAAFALCASTAAAQTPADTTPAVSQRRIPVTKQQGTQDTTTSTGALANPSETTGARSGMDTTTSTTSPYPGNVNRDTTTAMDTTGATRDTTGVVTDTSTGSVSTGVNADTTTRQGITGINDTTVTGDTTMHRDTLSNDTSSTRMTDTTTTPNTTVTTDTTTTPADTTAITPGMPGVQTTTPADTIGMYPSSSRSNRLGHGLWLGVAGGATVPIGNLHDGGYDTGWNVTVPIGWQSSSTPWGLRLDLSYDRLNGGTIATAPVSVTLSDANIWSGALDLTLQFPFGSSGSSFYLMGGGGIHHFTDVGSDNGVAVIDGTALSSSANQSLTKAGVNGGLGFNFGFGRAKLFLESRFVSVFTEGKNSNYVPIILGVRLF